MARLRSKGTNPWQVHIKHNTTRHNLLAFIFRVSSQNVATGKLGVSKYGPLKGLWNLIHKKDEGKKGPNKPIGFTKQPSRAVQLLFSPMAPRWAGGWWEKVSQKS